MTRSMSPDTVESALRRDPRQWGTTLIGSGDIEVAAKGLEKTLKAAGMTCRRTKSEKGRIGLVASQDASWLKVVARCLPQRADWLLLEKDHGLEISGDFYSFLWHRLLVLTFGLAVISGTSAIWLSGSTRFDSSLEWVTFTHLVLGTLAAFITLAYLLLGGAHHREDVWQTLLVEVEKAGGSLEPKGSGLSRRRFSIYAVLLTMAFSLGAFAIKDAFNQSSIQWNLPVAAWLAALCIAVVFLLSTAGLMARIHEASLRVDAIVTGLATLLAALFLFSPTFMWTAVGDSTVLLSRLAKVESTVYPETASAWKTQALQILIVASSPLVASIGFFFLMGSLKSTYLVRILTRLKKEGRRGSFRKAAEGGPHLSYLRFALGVTWTLMAVLVLCAFSALVLTGVQAIYSPFPYPEADLVAFSAAVVRLALGGLINGAILSWLTRFAWIAYASAAVVVFVVSVGQLYLSRRADRRTLLEEVGSERQESEREARRVLDRLAVRAGLVGVKLAVLPDLRPGAGAKCFFRLRGPERFVVLTEGALIDFGESELEAVLGHELVHLRDGHCWKMNLMRWLGRLTFVGDGFVLALQNSFGYEKRADHLLLAKGWADPEALERSLVIMMHADPGWRGLGILGFAPAGTDGPRPAPDEKHQFREDLRRLRAGEEVHLSFLRQWRLSWYLFRQQYFAALDFHYWHPTYRERREEARAWAGKSAVD